MNEQNTKHLIETCPILYTGVNMPITQNLMPFGFECGDGWFDILDELSGKIEALNRTTFAEQPVVATQVKEKFGSLRFYVGCATDEVYALIDAAERKSAKTCEACGAVGQMRGDAWIQTLCDKCAEE